MIQAVGSQVIVKLHHDEQVGLIIVPDKAKKENAGFWGEVISVGEDCDYDLKPGDKILYFRNEGFEVEEYLAIKQRHIHGVVI